KLQHLAPEQGLKEGKIGLLRVSETFDNSRVTVMGNSHSIKFQYIRLLKQLLRSSGVKVKPKSFDKLFALRTFLHLLPLCLRQERIFRIPMIKGLFLMMIKIGRRLPRLLLGEKKKTPPLTWGQIKKFTDTAKNLVISQGKPLTSTNLSVAMLTMLSAQIDYRIGSIGLDAKEKWLGFLLILLRKASLIKALLAPPKKKGV
ncbi:hypothetical protein EI555_002138, partial [Monodon monoceros]